MLNKTPKAKMTRALAAGGLATGIGLGLAVLPANATVVQPHGTVVQPRGAVVQPGISIPD